MRDVVLVFPNVEDLSRRVAEEFVRLAQQQIRARGLFRVALSGGSTPKTLYALLAGSYSKEISWNLVHFFWTDERCVGPEHPESNYRMARETLLSRVPLPSINVHRIPTDAASPERVASMYEQLLRTFFKLQERSWPEFDLVLLGLGEDGHVASLFAGSQALRETQRLTAISRGGNPPLSRVTLTVPVFNRARHLFWLVAGEPKASIVQAVLKGGPQPQELPARRIQPISGEALWFLDEAAAAGLQR